MTPLVTETRLPRDRLETLLRKMVSQRIVVVGDAMLDIYLSGEAERISPEAPVPVVTVHTRRYALGGAANVAANVAATGAECRLVAVIGDDARGDSLRGELAQNRLADDHIVVAAARPTTSKTRVTARGTLMEGFDARVALEDVDELDRQLRSRDVAAFVIETVQGKGCQTPTTDFFVRAQELCCKYGTLLISDEVQTGLGRTGKMFGFQHWNLEP